MGPISGLSARRRPIARAWLALSIAISLVVPGVTSAAPDTSPPTGSWQVWSVDGETSIAELRFNYADTESGVTHLIISCDGGPEKVYAYATKIFLPVRDLQAGGCGPGYNQWFYVAARARNGAGLESAPKYNPLVVYPHVELKTPTSPVTGALYTIEPVWPTDYTLPSTAICEWEFRWGSDRALTENYLDGSYGGILFKGGKADFCKEWTFTLPWAPVSQYQVSFRWAESADDGFLTSGIGNSGDERGFIVASVGGTSRHITSSTIPLTYVVTDKQDLLVSQQVTATRHSAGGLSVTGGFWHADQANEAGTQFTQNGGTVFKFTPDAAGVWIVGWDWWSGNRAFGFYHDPLARKSAASDSTKPLASAPVQGLPDSGSAGTTVRTQLTWTGSDAGSGLKKFILQRSRNGGSWSNVTLPSLKATSMSLDLAAGSTYRFRVRAVDNAGNQSDWKTGPSFKPGIVQESAAAITFVGVWTKQTNASSLAGALRVASAGTARANYTFTGRDVAWVAQTGPGKGLVDVYVDGSLMRTVDLGATSTGHRRIVFSRHWAAKGTHTISLRNRATPGRPQATLDAFLVLR